MELLSYINTNNIADQLISILYNKSNLQGENNLNYSLTFLKLQFYKNNTPPLANLLCIVTFMLEMKTLLMILINWRSSPNT